MENCERVQTLILGATVSGIALACALGKRCALVEQNMQLGAEYIAGMNLKPYGGEPLSGEAQAFFEECRADGAVDAQGRLHLSGVQAILARRLVRAEAQVRLYTRVVSILPLEEGFLVELFDAQGFCRMQADRVIDTRADGGGRPSLCAALGRLEEAAPPDEEWLAGALEGEYVLKLPLPEGASWPEARARLHDYWLEHAPRGWQMAAVAPCFVHDYEKSAVYREESGVLHCVSASFEDLFAAWEGGLSCAFRR